MHEPGLLGELVGQFLPRDERAARIHVEARVLLEHHTGAAVGRPLGALGGDHLEAQTARGRQDVVDGFEVVAGEVGLAEHRQTRRQRVGEAGIGLRTVYVRDAVVRSFQQQSAGLEDDVGAVVLEDVVADVGRGGVGVAARQRQPATDGAGPPGGWRWRRGRLAEAVSGHDESESERQEQQTKRGRSERGHGIPLGRMVARSTPRGAARRARRRAHDTTSGSDMRAWRRSHRTCGGRRACGYRDRRCRGCCRTRRTTPCLEWAGRRRASRAEPSRGPARRRHVAAAGADVDGQVGARVVAQRVDEVAVLLGDDAHEDRPRHLVLDTQARNAADADVGAVGAPLERLQLVAPVDAQLPGGTPRAEALRNTISADDHSKKFSSLPHSASTSPLSPPRVGVLADST